MKHINIIVLLTMLTCAASAASAVPERHEIPRDTSFTRHSSYTKVHKKHPYVRLVADTVPAGVTLSRDIEYAVIADSPYGRRALHVDMFVPDTDSCPLPAVLFIHGGGWRSGDKSLQHALCAAVASRGYITFAVEYRLTPEASYPAALHDIKGAVRWVRANARHLGVDPDRIALAGCSAGGHLAMLTGMTNGSAVHEGKVGVTDTRSDVAAVVNIDGISTLVSDYNLDDVRQKYKNKGVLPVNAEWLGGMPDDIPQTWNEASAILWVTDKSAPVCFINSELPRYRDGRDEIIPILNSHGIYTETHLTASPIHPFWFFHPWFGPTVGHAVRFLDRVL